MDVTNIPSTEPDLMDGEVQRSTALKRAGVSAEFEGHTVRSAEVTFRPGERTRWHTHDGIQVLYVTGGEGVVATREEERVVTAGDLILFPPGEEHWHGSVADAEEDFSHLYVITERTGSSTTVVS